MKGLILLLIIPHLHPNHVSVTDIVLNSKSGTLEVTIRLFAEDVENIIRKYHDEQFTLDENSLDGIANETMTKYIGDHFQLILDNVGIEIRFLGMELKDDMMFCYLESTHIESPGTFKIENTLLFDLQEEQVNFNHFKVNGEIRSVKTTIETPFAEIVSTGY
jgi:hypothetical protein